MPDPPIKNITRLIVLSTVNITIVTAVLLFMAAHNTDFNRRFIDLTLSSKEDLQILSALLIGIVASFTATTLILSYRRSKSTIEQFEPDNNEIRQIANFLSSKLSGRHTTGIRKERRKPERKIPVHSGDLATK